MTADATDADWLWHAARPVRGPPPTTAPSDTVAPLARRHGVVVPLRDALRAAGRSVPAVEALATEVQRANLARLGDLVRLIDAFARAGVEVWPIKGPVWSMLAWGRADLRNAGDLDILARGPHFAAAARVLREEGYVDPGLDHLWAAAAAGVAGPQEVPFSHPSRSPVDLHRLLLPHHVAIGLDAQARAGAAVELAGRRVLTLDPVDALIYTCAHAAGHAFARVAWVGDIAGLLARTDIDGRALAARARAVGALRVTRTGVGLAARQLGVEAPQGLGEDRASAALADEFLPRIVDQGLNEGGLSRAWRQLRSRDTLADRARYVARWPGDVTWEDVAERALPPGGFFAYPAVRAVRLIRRAVGGGEGA